MPFLANQSKLCGTEDKLRIPLVGRMFRVCPFVVHVLRLELVAAPIQDGEEIHGYDAFSGNALEVERKTDDSSESVRERGPHLSQHSRFTPVTPQARKTLVRWIVSSSHAKV